MQHGSKAMQKVVFNLNIFSKFPIYNFCIIKVQKGQIVSFSNEQQKDNNNLLYKVYTF